MKSNTENRREFIRRTTLAAVALPLLANCRGDAFAQRANTGILEKIKANAIPKDGEWNGAKDAPDNISWKTNLMKGNDAGETMVISGTVFAADGKTPAPNVLIYIYHTDEKGIYGRDGEHRHGRYRGWMLTDSRGRYEFTTIRPAPYPERRFAAHIHTTITTAELKEDWIDNYLFEGDALISATERAEAGKKGGFQPIVKLVKDSAGLWRAVRDIKLWNS
jgi:protocatechuate 3,4-dioxygenase beta subunit